MNVWLGAITLVFILFTGVIIYIKHRKLRYIIWNVVLFITTSIALFFGVGSKELWLVLVCSMAIGGSLLISFIHGYNKLVSTGKVYKSIGDNQKPKSFGNGYWK